MSSPHSAIARTARWTRWAVILLAAGTLLLHGLSLSGGLPHFRIARHAAAGPWQEAGALAHTALVILSLWQLTLLLGHLERGELFSASVTRRLRAFALLMLLAALVGTAGTILGALFAPNCLPGEACRRIFPLDMRALWTLILGLVFFLVARVLDEARRIDEDHRQII